ncbi:hypothetical protein ACOME3_001252 [Neoechinorhynchus agilis]
MLHGSIVPVIDRWIKDICNSLLVNPHINLNLRNKINRLGSFVDRSLVFVSLPFCLISTLFFSHFKTAPKGTQSNGCTLEINQAISYHHPSKFYRERPGFGKISGFTTVTV